MDKSALKKAYKQTDKPMGVYRIRNTVNGKTYIGYGKDVQARLNRHRAELKFGKHPNRELQGAWDTSGEGGLIFEVLDVLEPKEDSRTDLAEELRTLAEIWTGKLEKVGELIEHL